MRAYLPEWTTKVVIPILGFVWGVVTYITFGTPKGREEPGLIGWAAMTVLVVVIGVMLWLMASRKLPAYVLEVEDEDENQQKRAGH